MRPVPTSSVRLACASTLAALASLAAAPLAAFELGDLFRTPEQRAAARLEAGEHEALIENAPGPAWEGLGRYGSGDAEGAADAFARALEESGTTPSSERDALLYNRATAETRAGRLDEAIALYDELLERDPGHEDASHNREVARALKALEEEGGSPSGDGEASDEAGERGEGEGGDAASGGGDESGEPGDGGDERDANAAGEPGGDGDPSGERASEDATGGDAGTDAATGTAADTGEPDAARDAEARAAAAAALEAERQRAREGGTDDGTDAATDDGAGADDASLAGETRTPSEREQATEQWLRRIADDPSGLLRRRLERSHRGDYPEVGDGDEPW